MWLDVFEYVAGALPGSCLRIRTQRISCIPTRSSTKRTLMTCDDGEDEHEDESDDDDNDKDDHDDVEDCYPGAPNM